MMQDQGLPEFKIFSGNIQVGSDIAPIIFRVRIDVAGAVEFDFGQQQQSLIRVQK